MDNRNFSALPKAASTLPNAKSAGRYSAPAILDLGESKDFFRGTCYCFPYYDCSIVRGGSTASVLNFTGPGISE